MVKRRKVLIGAGSLIAGGAAATGTGALTSMSSGNRSVNVAVADDSKAYIGLQEVSSSPHSGFVTGDFLPEEGDGSFEGGAANKIALDFTSENSPYYFGGDGVNPDSVYKFDKVFQILQQASDNVDIWLTKTGLSGVDFYAGSDPSASLVYAGNGVPPLDKIPSRASSLAVSDKLKVGVEIDGGELNGGSVGEVSGTIQIHAIRSVNNRD